MREGGVQLGTNLPLMLGTHCEKQKEMGSSSAREMSKTSCAYAHAYVDACPHGSHMRTIHACGQGYVCSSTRMWTHTLNSEV